MKAWFSKEALARLKAEREAAREREPLTDAQVHEHGDGRSSVWL